MLSSVSHTMKTIIVCPLCGSDKLKFVRVNPEPDRRVTADEYIDLLSSTQVSVTFHTAVRVLYLATCEACGQYRREYMKTESI